jgi:hypothetical protein
MRTRKVIALSLISAGAAVLFSGCPSQPPGPCVIARTSASALTGGDPGLAYVLQYWFAGEAAGSDCTTDPAVALWPAGNFVGALWAEAYGPVTAINKLNGFVPEEFGWTNAYTGDYVECTPLNNVLYATPCTRDPVAYGNFTTDTEDSNNTCTVQGTDGGSQLVNGVVVTYNFGTTLVYTNAAAGEGTQIQGTVQITRASQTAGVAACVRNYTFTGLWPVALCNGPGSGADPNNDCNPNPQPTIAPPRPLGSGLLPGIASSCNSTLSGQDPIVIPSDDNCGLAGSPYILGTLGCGGPAKDNNGTGGTSICWYTNASATKAPWLP